MEHIYVTGYTSINTGETIIDDMKYDAFNPDIFFLVIIKPILEKLGCYNDGIMLNEGFVPLVDGYFLECNSGISRVIICQEILKRGYIYNTKKKTIVYSCFVHKMDKEGRGIKPRNCEEDVSDVEELISEPIDIPAPTAKSAPSRICFVEELKTKLEIRKNTKRDEIQIMPKIEENNEFVEELNHEIKLRSARALKREQKIMMKKKRRSIRT